MMKNIFIFLSLLFTTALSQGQEVVYTRDKYPEMRYLGLSGTVFYNNYNQIKGSAFLYDNWSKGSISLKNGVVLNDINFKIDLYAHQVLIYHELLKRIIVIDKYNLESLKFNAKGTERKYKKLDGLRTRSIAKNGIIAEVLTEGKISLYKVSFKNKIALTDPVKPFIDEFTDEADYYIYKDSNYLPIKLGKGNLIDMFPEYKTDIKQHAREFHLKLRKEDDFAKAVGYINELKK